MKMSYTSGALDTQRIKLYLNLQLWTSLLHALTTLELHTSLPPALPAAAAAVDSSLAGKKGLASHCCLLLETRPSELAVFPVRKARFTLSKWSTLTRFMCSTRFWWRNWWM